MEPIEGRPSIRDTKTMDNMEEHKDMCGPMPPKPTYYSPQSVRDAYYAWQECKASNG